MTKNKPPFSTSGEKGFEFCAKCLVISLLLYGDVSLMELNGNKELITEVVIIVEVSGNLKRRKFGRSTWRYKMTGLFISRQNFTSVTLSQWLGSPSMLDPEYICVRCMRHFMLSSQCFFKKTQRIHYLKIFTFFLVLGKEISRNVYMQYFQGECSTLPPALPKKTLSNHKKFSTSSNLPEQLQCLSLRYVHFCGMTLLIFLSNVSEVEWFWGEPPGVDLGVEEVSEAHAQEGLMKRQQRLHSYALCP